MSHYGGIDDVTNASNEIRITGFDGKGNLQHIGACIVFVCLRNINMKYSMWIKIVGA